LNEVEVVEDANPNYAGEQVYPADEKGKKIIEFHGLAPLLLSASL
jgi:hypothetical protein